MRDISCELTLGSSILNYFLKKKIKDVDRSTPIFQNGVANIQLFFSYILRNGLTICMIN